jgi:hypothetical protein
VSVGHLARAIEAVGIPTVCVYVQAFAHQAVALQVPRALVTPFPMGRNLGLPGNVAQQMRVIRSALALLEQSDSVSRVVPFSE